MYRVNVPPHAVALLSVIIGIFLSGVRGDSLEGANKKLIRQADVNARQKRADVNSEVVSHSSSKSSHVVIIGEHGNLHNAGNEQLLISGDRLQNGARLKTWQQALREDPALFAGCRSIFLDVGSNRGTHVRKLFEPQKYPGCPYLDYFDKGFGAAEDRARPFKESGICTFGFEANPRWTSTLQELEKAYTAQGWRAKWFAPEAVSDSKGTLTLWDNNHGAKSDWGFSDNKLHADSTEVDVPSIDFSVFIEELQKNSPPGYRLMKMDIESAEFQVLPKFVTKQLLCKNVLDTITIEWHDRVLKTETAKEQAKQLESQVMSPDKCTSGLSTTVLDFDDESYLDDGMPLPGQ